MPIEPSVLRYEYQEIMVRKDRQVREWIAENLDETEEYSIVTDHDGLSLRVGFRSIRARQLLLKLHGHVFSPGFAKPNPVLDEDGVWSARFGYSEPWDISPRYIPMQ